MAKSPGSIYRQNFGFSGMYQPFSILHYPNNEGINPQASVEWGRFQDPYSTNVPDLHYSAPQFDGFGPAYYPAHCPIYPAYASYSVEPSLQQYATSPPYYQTPEANFCRSVASTSTSSTLPIASISPQWPVHSLKKLPAHLQPTKPMERVLPRGVASSVRNFSKATPTTHNGSVPSQSDRKFVGAEKFIPRSKSDAVNGPRGEHVYRGSGTRNLRTSPIKCRAYTSKLHFDDPARQIVIRADQYNRDDFRVQYDRAKFFVIKSFTENDVHKCIKYNVWSSTRRGNLKLNAAFEDAQLLHVQDSFEYPIFLFFSVNGSGCFCGVAEMIGPVDFDYDMDFWNQRLWTGSFPVKWHMIKDVPNTTLRQFVLENNDNKPVTHSRDTQEVPFLQGKRILNTFHSYTARQSMLDRFMAYENLERLASLGGRKLSYDAPLFVPTTVRQRHPLAAVEEQSGEFSKHGCQGNESGGGVLSSNVKLSYEAPPFVPTKVWHQRPSAAVEKRSGECNEHGCQGNKNPSTSDAELHMPNAAKPDDNNPSSSLQSTTSAAGRQCSNADQDGEDIMKLLRDQGGNGSATAASSVAAVMIGAMEVQLKGDCVASCSARASLAGA